jgi:hypothetical protein
MKQDLDRIAERAADHLRRERIGEVFAHALQRGMWLLPAGAALVLLFRASNTPISALTSIALAVLPYSLWVALETAEAAFTRMSIAIWICMIVCAPPMSSCLSNIPARSRPPPSRMPPSGSKPLDRFGSAIAERGPNRAGRSPRPPPSCCYSPPCCLRRRC